MVRQRTQTINALRGHLADYGVIAPQGPTHVSRLAWAVENPDSGLPEPVRELGGLLLAQIAELEVKIASLETDLNACARQDEEAARLMTIPGIGPATAMALQAFAPPMEGFQRGRDCSAWCRASIPPAASRGWARHRRWARATGRHDRRPRGGSAWCDDRFLARQDAGAQTEDADRSGAGQPNGADRLGADDNEGDLSGSRRRLKRGSRRGMWAGRRTSKGKRSTRRDRANQLNPQSLQARVSDVDPIRVSPYGPAASDSRTNRLDRRQHLPHAPSRSKKVLASPGASIDGFTLICARPSAPLSGKSPEGPKPESATDRLSARKIASHVCGMFGNHIKTHGDAEEPGRVPDLKLESFGTLTSSLDEQTLFFSPPVLREISLPAASLLGLKDCYANCCRNLPTGIGTDTHVPTATHLVWKPKRQQIEIMHATSRLTQMLKKCIRARQLCERSVP